MIERGLSLLKVVVDQPLPGIISLVTLACKFHGLKEYIRKVIFKDKKIKGLWRKDHGNAATWMRWVFEGTCQSLEILDPKIFTEGKGREDIDFKSRNLCLFIGQTDQGNSGKKRKGLIIRGSIKVLKWWMTLGNSCGKGRPDSYFGSEKEVHRY